MSLSESTELTSMKQAESERVAVELVERYCQSNVLNKNDRSAYAAALALAREQPDRLHALLANAKPLAPLAMSRPPPNGPRDQIIGSARMEFTNSNAGKVTTLRAFINQDLRASGLAELSADEVSALAIA
jgi:hypothetical protein